MGDGSDTHGKIGYCPQTNPLFENLAIGLEEILSSIFRLQVDDHCKFYAMLGDVPDEVWKPEADRLLEHLLMNEHRSKKAEELSGGMKRKLCVIAALIGELLRVTRIW